MTWFPAAQKAFYQHYPRNEPCSRVDRPATTVWYGETRRDSKPSQPVEGPMADSTSDPLALWQKMIGEMEKGFNAFASQAMSSPQFSKAMNQASGATAGAQRQLSDLMEKYLLTMNLPSRAQMVGMSERLQSIEGQLNEIKALLLQMNAMSGITRDSTPVAATPRTTVAAPPPPPPPSPPPRAPPGAKKKPPRGAAFRPPPRP